MHDPLYTGRCDALFMIHTFRNVSLGETSTQRERVTPSRVELCGVGRREKGGGRREEGVGRREEGGGGGEEGRGRERKWWEGGTCKSM